MNNQWIDINYKKLSEELYPILETIRKGYTKGYTDKTKIKYIRKIVTLINNYLKNIQYHKNNEIVIEQYEKIKKAIIITFQRLQHTIEVPENIPECLVTTIPPEEFFQPPSLFNLTLPIVIKLSNPIEKMTEKFNLKTAMGLPTLESTKLQDIEDFLSAVEFIYEDLEAAGRIKLIKFITCTKIKGESKVRFGDDTPTTFEGLKLICHEKILATESSETIREKLNYAKQGRRSLVDYANYIEDLASRLAAARIREQQTPKNEQDIVKRTCKADGLAQFKKGVHDEVKLVVMASRPKSVAEALEIATSSNLDVPAPAASYYVNKQPWKKQPRPYQNQNYKQNYTKLPRQQTNFNQNNNYGNRGQRYNNNNNSNRRQFNNFQNNNFNQNGRQQQQQGNRNQQNQHQVNVYTLEQPEN